MRMAREMCFARLGAAAKRKQNWEIDLAEAVTANLVLHIRSAAGDKKAKNAADKVRLFRRGKKVAPTIEAIAQKLGGSPEMNEIDPDLFARAYGPRKGAT